MAYVPPHSGIAGHVHTIPNFERYKGMTTSQLKHLLQIYRDSLADILAKLMLSYDAEEEHGMPVDPETKKLSFDKIIVYHRKITKIIKELNWDVPPYVPSTLSNTRELFNEKQQAIYRAIDKLNTTKPFSETDAQVRARLKLFSDVMRATKSGSSAIFRNVLAPIGRGDPANLNAARTAVLVARGNISPEVCGIGCMQRGRQWPGWLRSIFGRSRGGTRKRIRKSTATRKRSA